MSDTTDLSAWLRPHCNAEETDKDGNPRGERRAVLITGAPARRNARDEYATIELHGRDPYDAAREVEGAMADYRSADPTFLEIREAGKSGSKAVRKLDPAAADAGPAAPAFDLNNAIGALVQGITAANGTLTGRVGHLEGALEHSQNERVKLAERAAMAETAMLMEQQKVQWMAEHASDGDFDSALKGLVTLADSPVGKALAAKLMAGGIKAKPDAKPDAAKPDADARVTALLAEVIDLSEHHPDAIRKRSPEVMAAGLRLSLLLDVASTPTAA